MMTLIVTWLTITTVVGVSTGWFVNRYLLAH